MTEHTVLSPAEPSLSVLRGNPAPEEVAALVTVLLGGEAEAFSPGGQQPHSAWSDPAARLRRPLHPGPGTWRRTLT